MLFRLNEEANDVNSRKEWKDAQKLYATIMPQKAYGPRIEITLQNPTLVELLLAYEEMVALGQAMTELFNMLKALYQCGLIPLEMMRCSPLQTVLTDTICLFPQKFTDSIANYFYLLLDHVLRGTFSNYYIGKTLINRVVSASFGCLGLQWPFAACCFSIAGLSDFHLEWCSS